MPKYIYIFMFDRQIWLLLNGLGYKDEKIREDRQEEEIQWNKKTCLRGFANNKGADQPAHPRSLISAIIIHYWKVSYLNLLQGKFQFSS